MESYKKISICKAKTLKIISSTTLHPIDNYKKRCTFAGNRINT
jgi:hypothetical protein